MAGWPRVGVLVMPVRLAAAGTASPTFELGQAEAGRFLADCYRDRLSPATLRVLSRVFAHPSVQRRRFAVAHPADAVDEDPDARMERYARWAVDLSAQALEEALARAGLQPAELSALFVNTCTGYLCPGIATYLVERLGLRRTLPAYDLVGAGCGGAVPNLELGARAVEGAPGGVAACVSVEICSATFQMGDDLALILSNALFADGASALLLWDRPEGLELVSTARRLVPEHRDDVRYVYRGGQLRNQLSPHVPRLVAAACEAVAGDLLAPRGLSVSDVRHWAVHPGGEKVLESVASRLGLTPAHLAPSRAVLASNGNLSSATTGFVLREILAGGIGPGEWVVLLAFGAGLSCHGALLRNVGGDAEKS